MCCTPQDDGSKYPVQKTSTPSFPFHSHSSVVKPTSSLMLIPWPAREYEFKGSFSVSRNALRSDDLRTHGGPENQRVPVCICQHMDTRYRQVQTPFLAHRRPPLARSVAHVLYTNDNEWNGSIRTYVSAPAVLARVKALILPVIPSESWKLPWIKCTT